MEKTPASPLYQQLADVLERAIRAGEYVPGAKIPSEHELAESHGIGRPTVRQATDMLVSRGVLVRRRGSGTYVRGVPARVDLFSLGGTLLSFESRDVALTTALDGAPRIFRVEDSNHPLDGTDVVRVRRVASAQGRAVVLEQLDFDATRFEGLLHRGLELREGSISELVSKRFGLRAIGADQAFRVEALNAPDARVLGRRTREPALRVDRTLHFDRFDSGAHVRMLCPDGPFVFSQRIGGNHA